MSELLISISMTFTSLCARSLMQASPCHDASRLSWIWLGEQVIYNTLRLSAK